MKTAMSVAVLGLILAGVAGRAADPDGASRIAWEDKVFPAFQKALQEKKYLVVYFRNDYCQTCQGPCKHCRPVDDKAANGEVVQRLTRTPVKYEKVDDGTEAAAHYENQYRA